MSVLAGSLGNSGLSKVAWLRMQVVGAACEEEQEGCFAGVAGLRHAKRHDAVIAPRGPMESWV